MSNDKCCGTCKYHCHENIDDGWVCTNVDSEYVAEWTEYKDFCDEWEGDRQGNRLQTNRKQKRFPDMQSTWEIRGCRGKWNAHQIG